MFDHFDLNSKSSGFGLIFHHGRIALLLEFLQKALHSTALLLKSLDMFDHVAKFFISDDDDDDDDVTLDQVVNDLGPVWIQTKPQ